MRISVEITIEVMGSARFQPKARMRIAATMAAADPAASASMWTVAARRFRLRVPPRERFQAPTRLTTRPMAATASMMRALTGGGAESRPIASMMTATAVIPRTIPLAAAARISARR